jgi:RHS repeat-associated protein
LTTTAITHWSEAASDEAGGWRGAGSADQHLFDPAGNWLGIAGFDSVIQFDGHLWEWYWNGDTYLSHFNNLYSANGVTNHFGTEVDDALFYPWGQHWEHGENFADLPYYDPKTNDIFAPLRVDSPGIGRWLSPDPIGEKAVRLDDPQTWNMYAYVRDNPTTLTDPSGTCEGNDAVPKTTGGEMNGSRDEGLCQSRNLNAEQGQGKGQVRTTAGVPVGNSPENHAAADKNPAVLKVTSSSDGKTGGVIQYDLTKAPGDPQNYQISQAESYAPRSGDP